MGTFLAKEIPKLEKEELETCNVWTYMALNIF